MSEKKEYRITFHAIENIFYRTDVLAESPEEAIKIFKENPDDNDSEGRNAWDEYEFGGREDINQIECEGYWDDEGHFNYFEPVVSLPEEKPQYDPEKLSLLIRFQEWMNRVVQSNPMQLETDNDDVAMMFLDGDIRIPDENKKG